jgi:hypothetical protein
MIDPIITTSVVTYEATRSRASEYKRPAGGVETDSAHDSKDAMIGFVFLGGMIVAVMAALLLACFLM